MDYWIGKETIKKGSGFLWDWEEDNDEGGNGSWEWEGNNNEGEWIFLGLGKRL